MGKQIGEFLAQRRHDSNLSQQRVADAAGISRPYLAQIENGHRDPAEETLQKLFKVLGITLEQALAAVPLDDVLPPGYMDAFAGPVRAYELITQHLQPEVLQEVEAALGDREKMASVMQLMLTEQPVPAPDGWLDLSKQDRDLVQRLVKRLLTSGG